MPLWKRNSQPPAVDPDVATVEAAVQPLWDTYFEKPDRLTPAQSALLHVWVTQGMVDNGGLPHFIATTGDRGAAVVTGFRTVGLDEYAEIIERTLRLYPTASAQDPDDRLSAQESWEEGGVEHQRLDELDDRASRISASRQIERAAAAFVREHAADFPGASL